MKEIKVIDKLEDVDPRAYLNIFFAEEDFTKYEHLIPYKNIYIVKNDEDLAEILDFFKKYDVKTLERKEK